MVGNKAHSLVRNMCSFVWKKRQAVSRCSIYIFPNDNWTLRMISACFELCQTIIKSSTYIICLLIGSPSQNPLHIPVAQDEKDKEGKAQKELTPEGAQILGSALQYLVFSFFSSTTWPHNMMAGSAESMMKGSWFKPYFCSLLAATHSFQVLVSSFVKRGLMTHTSKHCQKD